VSEGKRLVFYLDDRTLKELNDILPHGSRSPLFCGLARICLRFMKECGDPYTAIGHITSGRVMLRRKEEEV